MLGHCAYSIHIFSSEEFQGNEFSSSALKLALAVAAVFGAMAISFVLYDWFLRRRNSIAVHAAAKSDAILSIFPSVMEEAKQVDHTELPTPSANPRKVGTRLENFLSSGEFPEHDVPATSGMGDVAFKSKPMADL